MHLTTETTNLLIALTSAIISIIALVYTAQTYLLKRGHKFRCSISTASSMECNDTYVSSLTLENLKDRPAVIFEIYIRIGHGYYLQLDDFSEKPLILGGFEVYHQSYQPPLFYEVGVKRIKIDTLLNSPTSRRRLIVSTTEGKKTVKFGMKHWRPHYAFFKNYLTAIISPHYLSYDGKSYGPNVKYLLVFTVTGKKHVVSFKDGDEELAWTDQFKLTKDSLASREIFQHHIQALVDQGKLHFDSFEVIDFHENVQQAYARYENEIMVADQRSYLYYNLMGRLYTFLENRRLKKENEARRKKSPN